MGESCCFENIFTKGTVRFQTFLLCFKFLSTSVLHPPLAAELHTSSVGWNCQGGTEGTLQRPTTGHHNAAWVRAGVSGRRGHALEKRRPHLQKRQEKRKAPRKEHAKLLGLEAGGLHGVVEKATPARDPLWNLLNAISLSDRPGINCRS